MGAGEGLGGKALVGALRREHGVLDGGLLLALESHVRPCTTTPPPTRAYMESDDDRQAMMMMHDDDDDDDDKGAGGGRVPNMTRAATANVTRERLVGGHSQPATVAHATALVVAPQSD